MSDDAKEQLHGTITARAELDRAFARLIVEDVTSVMSKNLLHLMQHQDTQHQEQLAAIGEAVRGLGKIGEDVADLKERMDASEADRADMRERITRLEDVNDRLARIEAIVAARPAEREREHQAILDAIAKRDDGNG